MKSKLLEKLIKNKIDFCIEITSDIEKDKLLSLFDDYENIRWASGHRPMEFKICNYPRYIYLRNGKTITYYWERNNNIKEIKFNDLFDNNNYKQEIHITRRNQEIHAILKENDKIIKHTVAKCHPEDEFDFKVGSKLAYDRLFEKDKYEFKVGDKVRIRQWDDMVEEYGLNEFGIISCARHFIPDMKKTCGKIATIIDLKEMSYRETGVY